MEKAQVVKAIMNNKSCGLPAAIAIYNAMTDEERKEEIKKYISYGGRF